MADEEGIDKLLLREQVLKLLHNKQYTTKYIAEIVGVSAPTVRAYKAHVTMGTYGVEVVK